MKRKGDNSFDLEGNSDAVKPNRKPKEIGDVEQSESEEKDDVGDEEDEEELGNEFEVIIIGAGASGIGIALALTMAYMDSSKFLILEQGPSIGTSFRQWHKFTRFISPSWPSFPYGVQDLNTIVPDSMIGTSQHPTGDEYADYLEEVASRYTMNIQFNTKVTKIDQNEEDDLFSLQVEGKETPYNATCVVWCGGEWSHPSVTKKMEGCTFEDNTTVHYKDVNLTEMVNESSKSKNGVESNNTPVIVVGLGEAGADTAVALAEKGVSVIIIDGNDPSKKSMDPSCRLSPKSTTGLDRHSDKIRVLEGRKCVSVTSFMDNRDQKVLEVKLADSNNTSEMKQTLQTRSKVVLCTGFDVSQNPLIKDLFHWRDDGVPEVSIEYDESTKTPNLFLVGPMLRHDIQNCSVDKEDGGCETAVFCFIYKFRTRFQVVASEVIYRIINGTGGEEDEGVVTREGQMWGAAVESVREYYKTKGMLLTEITSACGNCG